MAHPLIMPPHLAGDALEQRYRRASDPVARRQWPIVWLLARGAPVRRTSQGLAV